MSRLIVYRVEHVLTGNGRWPAGHPARAGLDARCARRASLGRNAALDCLGFQRGYHYCGVETLTQLAEWFGSFRAQLLASDFALYEYQPLLTNLLRSTSGSQVAFPKYPATPRRRLDWPAQLIPTP